MVRTAAHAYLKYGWEGSTFGSLGSGESVDKKFGLNDRFTSLSLTNNRMNLPQLNRNTLYKFAYGTQAGTANVSFTLSNPWVIGTVLGAPTDAGSSSPYTHTWETDPSSGDFNLAKTARTIQVEAGIDGASGDVVRTFKGCIANTLNISTSVGGTVDCSLDLTYGVETAPSTTLGTAPSEPTLEFPYTFAHAELYFAGGEILQCQDVALTISQNAELLYAINSHQAVDAFKRMTDISGSFTYAWKDKSLLEKVLEQIKQGTAGSSTYNETVGGSPELRLTFEKSSTEKIVVTCSEVSITDYNISGIEAVNPLYEDISWTAKNINIVATDGQSVEE